MILAARPDELGHVVAREVSEALGARFPGEIDIAAIDAADPTASVLSTRADVAVHRMEHLPPELPEELHLSAVLSRRSFTDALVADRPLAELPRGARVATSSLRRRAMLLRARPDLTIVETHADVRSRIQGWRVGECDGVVLPTASLRHLRIDAPFEELDPRTFVPSAGQGAVGCVGRPGSRFEEFLEEIDDARTHLEVDVERGVARALEGGADAPLGVHASKKGDRLSVHAVILSLDGRRAVALEETISGRDPAYEADDLADRLARMGGDVLLAHARRMVG